MGSLTGSEEKLYLRKYRFSCQDIGFDSNSLSLLVLERIGSDFNHFELLALLVELRLYEI